MTPLSPLRQGGVERHVMEVSRRLVRDGAEVEVLCSEPGARSVLHEQRAGVKITIVPAWPARRDYCFAPALWHEMARRPWDIVHVQSYHTFVAPLAMLRALVLDIPYVVTFHGGGHSSALRRRLRRLQRALLRPLLVRARALIAVARFEIDAYGRELRLPAERFALIPNGTELIVADRARPAVANGPPTIASIGRLERYKGHHRVIAALPEVLALEPRARLLVVGGGPYEKQLRRQAAELGLGGTSIEFKSIPGDRPQEMAALLHGVAVVVLMSEWETHPLAALEAVGAGCRLVVSDVGGLSELAREGMAHAVTTEESPRGLARAIVAQLRLPRRVERPALSSWDDCAGELLALYRSVLGA